MAKNVRMMKIMINAALVLLLLCSIAFAAEQVGSIAQLSFTLISQDPDPVSPGEIVDLRWKIENTGGGSAEDVMVELTADYPFSIYSGELAKNIGVIQGRQTGDKAVIILYRVKVDENAVEGTSERKLRYKTAKTGWVELNAFDVNIQTSDATLSVDSVKLDPDIVAPGNTVKAVLSIKNLADSFLKDISVKLDLSSATLPFAPLDSVSEKRIKQLGAGESDDLSYSLIAEPDAAQGVYKIPLKITFNDNLGNSYNRTDLFGIIVGSVPDVSYYIDSTAIKIPGNNGQVSLKFVNKGLSDIKFLNVKVSESEYYDIISPEEVYIGNIDSDDYETADFDLYVYPGAPKELNIPLEVTYMDSNNKEYRTDGVVILKMYGQQEAVKYGLQQKNNSLGIIISVVVVVVGIIIYLIVRRRKKKK